MAQRAGHDLTYLAYSGVLNAIGIKGSRPVPPLNLVGDYGGGTMFLIAGLLAALVERATSGKGQVVDATMIDGILGLAMPVFAYMAAGQWRDRRASNLLDTGAPFYDTYETADGLHVAVGCLEPQFFATFAKLLPLEDRFVSRQYDASSWPDMRQAIAARFKTRSREEWTALFEPSDACVAPVLDFDEARLHPHNIARETHIAVGSLTRPAPAPRLSRSPLRPAGHAQADILETLRAFGVPNAETAISDGICA